MLKIDDNLLQEIGLGSLPTEDKRGLLAHIYETLEMRVGMRLADQMTNEQLDEFEMYFEAKDDAGAFKWLETNFPNYKDIVNEEFEKLKTEVAQAAPQILAAAQANPVPAPAPASQQPAQQGPQGDDAYRQPQQAYQQPLPPQQQPYQSPAPGYQPQDAPAPAQPYAAPPTPQPYQPASPQDQPPQSAPSAQPWSSQQPPAGPQAPQQPWAPPQPPAPQDGQSNWPPQQPPEGQQPAE